MNCLPLAIRKPLLESSEGFELYRVEGPKAGEQTLHKIAHDTIWSFAFHCPHWRSGLVGHSMYEEVPYYHWSCRSHPVRELGSYC